uniref:Uncharacterized protein n=1 Tax=Oryza punctata TaxID=4537 RepID=A0A0E0MHI3_ORYPU
MQWPWGQPLDGARFLLASTSEEGIESSDVDVAAVEASGEAVAVVLGASDEAVSVVLGASDEAVVVEIGDEVMAVESCDEAEAVGLGAGASDEDGEGLDEVQIDSPDRNLVAHQKNAVSAQKDDRNPKNKQLDEEKFNARYSPDVGVAALNPVEIDTVKAKSEVKVAALKPGETLCPPSTGKRKEIAKSLEQKQKVYRTTYGEIFRDPRHVPKKANPKNNHSKGFDMWGENGRIRTHLKEMVQNVKVDAYNTLLLQLYKMAIRLNDLIPLCQDVHPIRSEFLARAFRNCRRNEDWGVRELIIRAERNEEYFKIIALNLKVIFERIRTTARRLRQEVIRIGGKPINDPLSKPLHRC